MEISSLQKVGTTKETNHSASISNDNLKFEIIIKNFERDIHHYEFGDNNLVLKIDGNKPWGVDGSYPAIEIDHISLVVKGKAVSIPSEAYCDTFEFDLPSLNIFQNSNGTMLIVSSHSDGAGYYDLVWIFKNQEYKGRFISSR
jgi:hypothetical protein